MKLHEYQKNAVKFSLMNGTTYQMLDCGLGKTAIALSVAQRMKLPTIVFAPLRPACITWPEEIEKWAPNLTYTVLHGAQKEQRRKLHRDIYIIPYSSLKWFHTACNNGRFKLRKYFTIFDETSMIKDSSTKRFKMMKSLQKLFSNYYRMNLSATPATGGLHDLWSQYYMLDGGKRLGSHYYKYRDKYFNYTGAPYYRTDILPGAEKVIYKKVAPITYRLKAEDYLDMPGITYNNIKIKMPSAMKSMYRQFKKDFEIVINGKEVVAQSQAVVNNKLRQLLQGGLYTDHPNYEVIHKHKAKILKEIMDTNEGKPILCPIQFKFEKRIVEDILGHSVPVIDGDTPNHLSLTYIKEWNKGNLPLLLCHPASLSHGLNLQTGGSIIVWMAIPWSLDHYLQLIGRLYRQGQYKGVVVHHLLFDGTMDTRVASVLQRKDATQQDLLNELRR